MDLWEPEARLTERQRTHYGKCFDGLDANGDGAVTRDELKRGLTGMGVKVTDHDAAAMVFFVPAGAACRIIAPRRLGGEYFRLDRLIAR